MLGTFAVLALVVLAAAGLGLSWLLKRHEGQREAFEALAARRGWSLQITNQSLGRPALLRLSSRGGSQWVAQSSGAQVRFGIAPKARMTEFSGTEPHWPAGYLFIGPAAPEPDNAPLTNTQRQSWVRARIIADGMGADLNGLAPFQGPENLTIMANADPSLRVDLGDLSKLWKGWSASAQSAAMAPVIMLGPEGLRVRLWDGANTADQMESLIDFAFNASRTIGDR